MWPVYVNVIGDQRPEEDDAVVVQAVPQMGWAPPWPWYPSGLPHWGLATSSTEAARAWFAGVPEGQEKRVFADLLEAMKHRRRILSPLTLDTLSGQTTAVHVAVLATPG
ncbi:hypothetical protein [Sulfobacillus harzensis]|uniref:Uncharacterized protein n=1 Tax=Sulfobacillus harzensis TaxID=2729629 RepID=A0A7Y0L2L4_9FIRM|nr:hypothetical protein [Sulfobacillus harzensis]NMP21928.1 hypothetical protein [Sulfobacillus harzensis]